MQTGLRRQLLDCREAVLVASPLSSIVHRDGPVHRWVFSEKGDRGVMLKVNLLPPEKRKLKRTPYYALVPLVVSVALLTGSLAASAYFYIEDLRLQEEVKRDEAEVNRLESKKVEFEQLVNLIAAEQGRIGSIEAVTRRPVYWGEVLAAVVEVTSKNPRVWLDEIVYLDASRAMSAARRYNPSGQDRPAFGISIKCNIAPDMIEDPKNPAKPKAQTNVAYMIKFRKDLKEHPKLKLIFPEFHPKIPEWDDKADEGSKEGIKMTFEVILVAK